VPFGSCQARHGQSYIHRTDEYVLHFEGSCFHGCPIHIQQLIDNFGTYTLALDLPFDLQPSRCKAGDREGHFLGSPSSHPELGVDCNQEEKDEFTKIPGKNYSKKRSHESYK
jgi:hypothetical protein